MRALAAGMIFAGLVAPALAQGAGTVVGDAMPAPLTDRPGDAMRGRAIVADRTRGLCILCHSAPLPEVPFQGNLSPSLAGAGSRYDVGQLRLRIVDGRRLNPDTIMPPYGSMDGLDRVGTAWQGRTILGPQEIEDVVAYLATLRDDGAEPTRSIR